MHFSKTTCQFWQWPVLNQNLPTTPIEVLLKDNSVAPELNLDGFALKLVVHSSRPVVFGHPLQMNVDWKAAPDLQIFELVAERLFSDAPLELPCIGFQVAKPSRLWSLKADDGPHQA